MGIVTLDAVKAQLRIDGDGEDALLEGLILAAAAHVEQNYGLVADRRTASFALDRLGRMLTVPARPIVPGTVSATYVDTAGDEQVLDVREILLDGWTRLLPSAGRCFPAAACEPGAVRISAEVGFDADASIDACGDALRVAIIMMAAAFYDDREGATEPAAVGMLLGGFRLRRV